MPAINAQEDIACGQCGTPSSDTRTVANRELCPHCASRYAACDCCQQLTEDAYHTVDGGRICEGCSRGCYAECYRCENFAPNAAVATRADGGVLCDNCSEHYWNCEDCAELINGGRLCTSCASNDEYRPARAVINPYYYRPTPNFFGTGTLFFGIELEISSPYRTLTDNAQSAQRRLGHVGYLKSDSSISGTGFEVVTHPMSYDWAIDHFPWSMLGELEQSGCNADGNGLHVHVSRAGFTGPAHVFRWMKFIYRNEQQVTAIARRDSGSYAAFRDCDRQQVKCYAKGDKGQNRYCAINTLNDHTFELRVFASSLDPGEVKAALALASASIEYTRQLTFTDILHSGGWTWSAFARWVGEQSKYAPLKYEMETRACAC